MAASLQVDGESTSCQQAVGICNSESHLAPDQTLSQTKCSCSTNYVNKIIRVTTRQKQRIKINNFANLLNLCDAGGIKIDQSPSIESKRIYYTDPDNPDGRGEDQSPPCPCCHCPTGNQQECVYLKYCGPLVTFPYAPASNMSLRQRASDADCKSSVGGHLLGQTPSGSHSHMGGESYEDNGMGSGVGGGGGGAFNDEGQGRRRSSVKILDRLTSGTVPLPYLVLGAALLAPLAFIGDYESNSNLYPTTLFSISPDTNDSDGVDVNGGKLGNSDQNRGNDLNKNDGSGNNNGGNSDGANRGQYPNRGVGGDNAESGPPGSGNAGSNKGTPSGNQAQNQQVERGGANAYPGGQQGNDGSRNGQGSNGNTDGQKGWDGQGQGQGDGSNPGQRGRQNGYDNDGKGGGSNSGPGGQQGRNNDGKGDGSNSGPGGRGQNGRDGNIPVAGAGGSDSDSAFGSTNSPGTGNTRNNRDDGPEGYGLNKNGNGNDQSGTGSHPSNNANRNEASGAPTNFQVGFQGGSDSPKGGQSGNARDPKGDPNDPNRANFRGGASGRGGSSSGKCAAGRCEGTNRFY